jgi:tetratricopeptide (TPR) repeat protein
MPIIPTDRGLPMFDNRLLQSLLLMTCGLLAGPELAAQTQVADSQKDAAYECTVPATPDALRAKAEELARATYDKNKLGCAADLWFKIVQAKPADVASLVSAVSIEANYIEKINTLWDFDLYGIRAPEWSVRLRHAAEQGDNLVSQLASLAPNDPRALTARARYAIAWPAKQADGTKVSAEAHKAIHLLSNAIAKDPRTMDGRALLMLGRLYYELPEFDGGDADKATAALERARTVAPHGQEILGYLAYVYQESGRHDDAVRVLRDMLATEPQESDLQVSADQLRNARDLCKRIGEGQLAGQLDSKRTQLLAQYPQLLTRAPIAANMHGGVDPITGKEY